MIEEVVRNEDRALNNLQPEQENPETVTGDSDGLQKTDTKSVKLSQEQVWKSCFPELSVQITMN